MQDAEVFDFGLRLKQLRQSKKLTQKAVAARLDLRKETISKYENNLQTPTIKTITKLAILYNTSADYLLGLESGTIIKLHHLSDEKAEWLRETIDLFFKDEIEPFR